jgi:histidinol-phosphate aminotransferase
MSIKLIRPELKNFKGYQSDRKEDGVIWLDANESPWDKTLAVTSEKVNRYPKMNDTDLVNQLANYYQVTPSNLLLTRGSDEGIDLLVRLFCQAYCDSVLICPPTFPMYGVSATVQGAKIIQVPLLSDTFSVDFEKVKVQITPQTKIVFLCTPNNPTGSLIPIKEIINFCKEYQERTIIVVDEAYIEFANTQSIVSYVQDFNNLVVLRTLSKAFGLAGLRCGVLLAQADLINHLRAIMPPFAFSTLIFKAIFDATKAAGILTMQQQVSYIQAQRARMREALQALSLIENVWESQANFLLVRSQEVQKIYETAQAKGIALRAFPADPILSNCLRITIGLKNQNERLLAVLQSMDMKND